MDTGPGHTAITSTSNRYDHSQRATSCRTGTFTFSTAPPGSATPLVQADAVLFGSTPAANAAVAEFEASVGTAPASRTVDTVDYLQMQKDVFCAELERRQRDPVMTRDPFDSNKGKIWIELMGGAVGDVKPKATAFPYRDAEFAVQYQSRRSADAPEDVRVANIEWLRDAYQAMAPFNTGHAYVNYPDPDLSDWDTEYFATNYHRLARVKT